MLPGKFELIHDRLCELYHDSDDIAKKWQPIVEGYVEDDIWLYPYKSKIKEKDEQGRYINGCTSDDISFAGDFSEFEDEYLFWSEEVKETLLKLPPRFHTYFEDDAWKAERFSAKYDEKYNFVGDVPDLLQLYDDFYKERQALKGVEFWTVKVVNDNDVAFELRYDAVSGKLYLNGFLVKRCQLHSVLDEALQAAFTNEKYEAKAPSKVKPSISAIRIPKRLRNRMFHFGGGIMKIQPQVTYGELRELGWDEPQLTEELLSMHFSDSR